MRLALILFVMIALAGCLVQRPPVEHPARETSPDDTGPADTGTTDPLADPGSFETVQRGYWSSAAGLQPRGETAWSQAEWDELWAKHTGGTSEPGAAPTVNFTKRIVVAVFDREHGSTGYTIDVKSISADASTVSVSYGTQSPGLGCMVGSAMTQPFHIVSIPRPQGQSVTFANEGNVVVDC